MIDSDPAPDGIHAGTSFRLTGPPEADHPGRWRSSVDRKELGCSFRSKPAAIAALSSLLIVLALSACGSERSRSAAAPTCNARPRQPVINFAAYSTPREAYGKIIPAFVSQWKEDHDDQNVIFQESYAGSTTQAANVVAGYEADVVALSLGPDVRADRRRRPDHPRLAGRARRGHGLDLGRGLRRPSRQPERVSRTGTTSTADGVEILTPDPASSGGARWNLVSLWGSALRGYAGVTKDDTAAATTLMQDVLGNVTVFDKSARDSIQNFEAGNGDVAITYENEVLTAQEAGLEDEAVYPPSTVLIENPVAVVDKYVDEHCVRDVAEAFVEYLHTPEAKELYTDVGFLRSTDIKEAKKGGGQFPPIEDLFTVDEIGGWDALNDEAVQRQRHRHPGDRRLSDDERREGR